MMVFARPATGFRHSSGACVYPSPHARGACSLRRWVAMRGLKNKVKGGKGGFDLSWGECNGPCHVDGPVKFGGEMVGVGIFLLIAAGRCRPSRPSPHSTPSCSKAVKKKSKPPSSITNRIIESSNHCSTPLTKPTADCIAADCTCTNLARARGTSQQYFCDTRLVHNSSE